MLVVLSLLHSHFDSSSSSVDHECRTVQAAADSQTKPADLGRESACVLQSSTLLLLALKLLLILPSSGE